MNDLSSRPVCPTCRKQLSVDTQQAKQVFCSKRCQTIDLGSWLSDQYRIPVEDTDDEDPEAI